METGLRQIGEFLFPFFVFILYTVSLKLCLKLQLSKALCQGFMLTSCEVLCQLLVTTTANYFLYKQSNFLQTVAIYSAEILLTLLYTVGILVFFVGTHKKKEKLLLTQREKEKLKRDLTYYKIQQRQNQEIQSFLHDIKNHLAVISSLNTDKETKDYISKIMKIVSNVKVISNSGNKLLDIVLNRYAEECNLKGINFSFDVSKNNLNVLESHDTVTVLGNLFDNAIEAAEKSQKKTLSFLTDRKNGYSIIILTNSCDFSPKFSEDNIPLSSKPISEYHGIGLKNVRRVVEKYDGDAEFIYDEKERLFTVTVMIKV